MVSTQHTVPVPKANCAARVDISWNQVLILEAWVRHTIGKDVPSFNLVSSEAQAHLLTLTNARHEDVE
jgi:hypothetical protein